MLKQTLRGQACSCTTKCLIVKLLKILVLKPKNRVKRAKRPGRQFLLNQMKRSSGLKGVPPKQEQCMELYVQNIHRNNDDIDKDIQKEVHEYAEMKGLNILSVFIIHNKFRSDVVGCKIQVPISLKIMH